jgi:hypothetical protein
MKDTYTLEFLSSLSPEDLNILLAESLNTHTVFRGERWLRLEDSSGVVKEYESFPDGVKTERTGAGFIHPTDYASDLNACHKLETGILKDHSFKYYTILSLLTNLSGMFRLPSATARERAIAAIVTLASETA